MQIGHRGNRSRGVVFSAVAIIGMILITAFLLGGCGDKEDAPAEPTPTPNVLEEAAGKYKRTAITDEDGGGLMGFFSGVVNLFGDVTLTLDPDGSGILDFTDLPGSYDSNYESVTWAADHTIYIQGETCTWRYEDGTLYIEGAETAQEFERMDD